VSFTFDDIARKAGVSRATISRFFNGTSSIGPETEKRIQKTINELNYHPPKVRRGPKLSSRTKASGGGIALIAVGGSSVVLSHPNSAAMVESLQAHCHRTGYSLLLDQMLEPHHLPFSVTSGQASACIAIGAGARRSPGESEKARACIRTLAKKMPCALLFSPGHAVRSVAHFTGNDVAIGSAAYRVLSGKGCRRIVIVMPDTIFHEATLVRARACLDRAALAGMEISVDVTAETNFEPERHFPRPITRFSSPEDWVGRLPTLKDGSPLGIFLPLDDQVAPLHRALQEKDLLHSGKVAFAVASTTAQNLTGLDPAPLRIDIGLDRICAALVEHLVAETRGKSTQRESGTFLLPPELL